MIQILFYWNIEKRKKIQIKKQKYEQYPQYTRGDSFEIKKKKRKRRRKSTEQRINEDS